MIFWVLNIIALVALSLVLYRQVWNELSPLVFSAALGLRILASIIAGLIFYRVYPGGDSTFFYESAKFALEDHSIWSIIAGDFSPAGYARQPRVVFFIQILSVLLALTGGSYWLASLYFALISFAASLFFVVQFARLYPNLKLVAMLCFLFLPSVLFWSSTILKDTISYSALVIVIALILKVFHDSKIKWFELVLGAVCFLVLFKIKHYLLIISLLFAGITLSIYWFKKLSGIWRLVVAVPILVISLGMTQFVHPYLKVGRIPQTIYENNKTIIDKTSHENQLGIVVESPDWKSVLLEIPRSLYAGIFSPTVFEKTPKLGIVHKIENLLMTSLMFLSILSCLRLKPRINWKLVIPSIFCIAVLATLLAMTTPNIGTLLRYRNAYLPFLFLILSILPFQYLTSKTS